MEITRELFEQQRRRRFGTANPERMKLELWEWIIRERATPYATREHLGMPHSRDNGPVWTFDRMGATTTPLPDGRSLHVGGEYEDFYDPEFCIFNDVVVLGPDEKIKIYGYPPEVFPPTDFHTATLLGERIIIIGCIGYRDSRRSGFTPVYSLDVLSLSISQVATTGQNPGWIHEHKAELDANGIITIREGKVDEAQGGKQRSRRNFEDYALDTSSWAWSRTTDRNWRQFSIRREDKKVFVLDNRPNPVALLRGAGFEATEGGERNVARGMVRGIPLSLQVEIFSIELVIEASLNPPEDTAIANEIQLAVETAIGCRCVLEALTP